MQTEPAPNPDPAPQPTEGPPPEGPKETVEAEPPAEDVKSSVVRLTDDPADDWDPIWSPDGTRILFTSNRVDDSETGDTDVFVMRADGTDVRRLTDDDTIDWVAAEGFSPDGTQILFTGNPDGDREIYVMRADGSDVRQLTRNDDYESDPAWSPDGSRILFTSDRDGRYGLYSMQPDGSGVHQLTVSGTDNFHPAWSPDGSRILFTSDRDGEAELFMMDADGSNERQLTDNDAADTDPAWSPDGTRAVFTAHPWVALTTADIVPYPASIIRFDINGPDGHPAISLLTGPDTNVWDPAWSPDGERILFVSDSDKGRFDLHVMRADGTGVRRLTDLNTDDSVGVWSPHGDRIIFASDHEGQYDIYTIGV